MAEFKVLDLSPLQRIIPPPPRTPAVCPRRQVVAAAAAAAEKVSTTAHLVGVILTAVWPRHGRQDRRWFSVLALLRARQRTERRPILAIVTTVIVLVVINIFLVQQRRRAALAAIAAAAAAVALAATEMVWSLASARRSPSWTSSRRPRPTPPSTSSTIEY